MTLNNPTILVADDTPTNIQLVDAILGQDHEILVAANGQEALEIALAELPDLILMDVMMPVMDGFEACLHLKAEAQTQDIPVLFLTALTDVGALLRGFQVGALDYVSKPFHPEELGPGSPPTSPSSRPRTESALCGRNLKQPSPTSNSFRGSCPSVPPAKRSATSMGNGTPWRSTSRHGLKPASPTASAPSAPRPS